MNKKLLILVLIIVVAVFLFNLLNKKDNIPTNVPSSQPPVSENPKVPDVQANSDDNLESQLPPDWRGLSYKERRAKIREGQYPVPNWESLSRLEQIRLLKSGNKNGHGKDRRPK